MMKLTLIALVFAAVVTATPHPWAAPQASLVPTPSRGRNRTHKNRTHKNPHKEPTPTFQAPCECPKPIVPMNLLSENERCLMEHATAMGCYLKAKGGCPSPAPACGLGVLPAIPYTH
ncbi:hypothetical protein CC86DRAFT_151440 [Ophiobolus disseminans]|uniref:Uncharacterized protein n=1 Tax=Ophiobolus disseminans TaxID=1469910 RepID=A0A6A6ZCK4_9PLEO|nr:hypothetical protein CC86DRAFT_151440 [Ophiobolus disseminans]